MFRALEQQLSSANAKQKEVGFSPFFMLPSNDPSSLAGPKRCSRRIGCYTPSFLKVLPFLQRPFLIAVKLAKEELETQLAKGADVDVVSQLQQRVRDLEQNSSGGALSGASDSGFLPGAPDRAFSSLSQRRQLISFIPLATVPLFIFSFYCPLCCQCERCANSRNEN